MASINYSRVNAIIESMGYPNWFQFIAVYYFHLFLSHRFADQPNLNFLQIGAYTGDASEWLLENILTNETCWLTDVDTWCGSDEEIHKEFDWKDIEKYYDDRMSNYKNLCKIKGYSADFLQNAPSEHYDFIYIDGDHRAEEVYKDAVFAWRCLKNNGIMAFDDYFWNHDSGDPNLAPKKGIDKFLNEYFGRYSIIVFDRQVWITKNE